MAEEPTTAVPAQPPAANPLLAMLFEVTDDGVLVHDRDGVILHANASAARMFGYAAADLIGQPLSLLLPERFREGHRGHLEAFVASGSSARPMEQRLPVAGRRRDGSEFAAEVSLARWNDPAGVRLGAIIRDAGAEARERRRDHMAAGAAARLAASLNLDTTMTTLLDLTVPGLADWAILDVVTGPTIGEGPILRRVSGRVEHRWAQALERIERRGLTWESPSAAIDVLRSGEPIVVPVLGDDWLEAHTADPEELAIHQQLASRALAVLPIAGSRGTHAALTLGLSLPDRDLDEDLMTDAQVLTALAALSLGNALLYRDAQHAAATRDRLLRIVSHDLRNPSSAIRMCAAALLRRPDDPASERATTYRTIHEAAGTIHRLVNDLLDLASLDAGRFAIELRPEALRPVLESLAEMFAPRAAERGLRFHTAIEGDLPELLLDHERLIQAVGNLLDNAIRFTPVGGTVELLARADREGALIVVRDSGVGIAPVDLPQLFDRAWQATARPGGSGLGLPITHGIVEAHGGTIEATSALGRGTTFRVQLPPQSR